MMYLTQNTIYLYTHMCLVTADSLWPMNCSSPGSSVHGIFQARILEWVAISFSCTHIHTHTHIYMKCKPKNLDWDLNILYIQIHLVKAMVYPVVMYGCESWTVKKAERQRIDAFELWCWKRLLRVPWTARRSNQSILKEISPGYSLEGMMLKLKLQYFDHLMRRVVIGKDSDAGRDWGQEEKGTTEDEMAGWHHWLDGHEFGWTPGVGDGQGGLACCNSWGHRVGHDWVTELNWSIYKWMDVVSKPRTIALFFCLYTSWISHILTYTLYSMDFSFI